MTGRNLLPSLSTRQRESIKGTAFRQGEGLEAAHSWPWRGRAHPAPGHPSGREGVRKRTGSGRWEVGVGRGYTLQGRGGEEREQAGG